MGYFIYSNIQAIFGICHLFTMYLFTIYMLLYVQLETIFRLLGFAIYYIFFFIWRYWNIYPQEEPIGVKINLLFTLLFCSVTNYILHLDCYTSVHAVHQGLYLCLISLYTDVWIVLRTQNNIVFQMYIVNKQMY